MAALLTLLVLVSAGPLLAPLVPAGPARLLAPGSAAAAAGVVLAAWALVVWPATARDRSPGRLAAEAVLLLAAGAPFLFGLALAAGRPPEDALPGLAVAAGSLLAAHAWLSGPGRRPGRDRFFVAGAAAFSGALPLGAYALAEFAGAGSAIAFRLSPILAARGPFAGASGADPFPFLLLASGTAAALHLAGGRGRAAGAASLLVLLAGGAARAEGEVRAVPVLGEFYRPGRPVPVRIEGAAAGEIRVTAPGPPATVGLAGEGRRTVWLPGTADLRGIRVASPEGAAGAELRARPAAAGQRLIVSMVDVPAAERERAAAAGFAISRFAGTEDPAVMEHALGIPDAWLDPAGRLPAGAAESRSVTVLRDLSPATLAGLAVSPRPLRWPWEEDGRILSPERLFALFPAAADPGPARSRTALIGLAAFAVAVLALRRFARGRRLPAAVSLALVPVLAGLAVAVLAAALPVPPPWTEDEVVVEGGGRYVRIRRVRASRPAVAELLGTWPPVALGAGEPVTVRADGNGFGISVPLGAGETRLLVEGTPFPSRPVDRAEAGAVWEDGLLGRPAGPPRPPLDFLTGEADRREEAWLRAFLDFREPAPGRWGIRLGPEREPHLAVGPLVE